MYQSMSLKKFDSVPLKNVRITDDFWSKRQDLIRDEVISYQYDVLNNLIPGTKSNSMKNLKIAAGLSDEEFEGGYFLDSDIGKWLETVGHSLSTGENKKIEELADEVINIIEKAQLEDGYFNTRYIVKRIEDRWKNLRVYHELYCAGHLIEAAVAYYLGTGKRKLLDIVSRYADHIDSLFGDAKGKKRGYPGHEEIELALVKLYHSTGKRKYLKLSKFFIDERGKTPNYFDIEEQENLEDNIYSVTPQKANLILPLVPQYAYQQAHIPVREQKEAVGHAVRATYLYTAMADLALEYDDEDLFSACKALWESTTKRKMFITGGIGSSRFKEAFSIDYDLPNDTCHTETCASIGLVFWALRMLKLEANGDYADIMEKALYNGILSGVSLDGKKYFYTNPLEVWPKACENRKDMLHVRTARLDWHGCACCPPNLTKLIASLGDYIYTKSDDEIYINLYMSNKATIDIQDQRIVIVQKTKYPWKECVNISILPEKSSEFTIGLRIPGWCKKTEILVNGKNLETKPELKMGYAKIKRKWEKGDIIQFKMSMPILKMHTNLKVRKNIGKIALMRGPFVYCIEEVDNGDILNGIMIPKNGKLNVEFDKDLLDGIMVIKGDAIRNEKLDCNDILYSTESLGIRKVEFKAVPYYSWANRSPGEMLVWIRADC